MAAEATTTSDAVRPGDRPLARRSLVPAPQFAEPGTVVLADYARRTVHEMNHTAGAVWACCDGRSTGAEIAIELAEIFAVEASTIAADVDAAVADLDAFGLVVVDEGAKAGEAVSALDQRCHEQDGTRYLTFAPCGCGPDLDEQTWAEVVALDVGDLRLGVRCSSAAIADRVRKRLADLVVDDPRVAPSFTVQGDGDASCRVYANDALLGELRLDRGLAWLEARVHGWAPEDPEVLRLDAVGVEGPRGIALLPRFPGAVTTAEQQFTGRGEALHPGPVAVTVASREVGDAPLQGIVVIGDGTARLSGLVAFRALLPMVHLRGDEDLDGVTEHLGALAVGVPVIRADAADAAHTAAALVRQR